MMKKPPLPLDLKKVKVYPLGERNSESAFEEILIDPQSPPPPLPQNLVAPMKETMRNIAAAHQRKASVMLIYGAHLIKNGGSRIINALMESGWITHLAT